MPYAQVSAEKSLELNLARHAVSSPGAGQRNREGTSRFDKAQPTQPSLLLPGFGRKPLQESRAWYETALQPLRVTQIPASSSASARQISEKPRRSKQKFLPGSEPPKSRL